MKRQIQEPKSENKLPFIEESAQINEKEWGELHKRINILKKDLRLLLLEKCNRNCEGCCNKDFNLKNLPIETQFAGYENIMLTGGEPLLDPFLIIKTIRIIKNQNKEAKIILYTAKTDTPYLLIPILMMLNGLTVTLHEQKDVKPFKELTKVLLHSKNDFKKTISFRVNIFKGINVRGGIANFWKVKDNMEWIKNCPLPTNEVFKRISKTNYNG